ncbi:class I SAM-dependent methyltransferase [Thiohalobacter sp. IOR34]|uniref:class I SAM-dependent methyltransferase n=1 Tax=Thiohalobacter sp. IOR34 TaxID=3057176 RepID=UPI0025B0DF6D|nr:class I SAM-dependent methyltransferase [Thiohalobacter sp. IOR34]WJW75964.1 class I SAM-dependent methyltransferase [Thiohalobacter sp. IOR34]
MSGGAPLKHSFGFQQVDPAERQRRIRQVFESVAPRYDLMNDFMSFGIHRLWKRVLVREAAATGGQCLVDLAGGTGDVARALSGDGRAVLLVDPSLAMMQAGRARGLDGVRCIAATGEALPLADASVDTLTIAFGIRNMTDMEEALREMHRVLKPGGRCLCLEFSRPWALIRPFYNLYSFLVIPRLGALVARQPAAYHYLVESIRRFPDQETMRAIMLQAGFESVRYRNLSFGIACLHIGVKADV